MATKPFYRRRFLNRRGHHAGAYVIAECGTETYRDFPELVAYLTIADCSRVVTLDLGGGTTAEISNSLRKAEQLRVVVEELCEALQSTAAEVNERRNVARRARPQLR